jgi:hypothetical protein
VVQKVGPLHQVEFVIEIVGPKSMPAKVVASLLQPDWFRALGEPRIWVMAPQDTAWQPLTAAIVGSYDSLALTWPLLGAEGNLSKRSVLTLAGTAERFAATVQRRSLTMPPPVDIDNAVRGVAEIASRLDIGVGIGVMFVQPIAEEIIWRTAIELGLSLNSVGEFVWGVPPQLTVIPLNDPTQFTLGGVKAGRTHEGLSLGFTAPLVASPMLSFQSTLKVANEFAGRFRGLVIDEDGNQMSASLQTQYENNIRFAIQAFESAGLVSGSAEATRLFGS